MFLNQLVSYAILALAVLSFSANSHAESKFSELEDSSVKQKSIGQQDLIEEFNDDDKNAKVYRTDVIIDVSFSRATMNLKLFKKN